MTQVISLFGAILILMAFALQQAGRWQPDNAKYLWANFLGSAVLAVIAWLDRQWGFLLLEGVWALVSAWSLLRQWRR